MAKVRLEPISHTYSDGVDAYLSVSKFISLFHDHFEDVKEFWLMYKAFQYLSDLDASEINNFDIRIKQYAGEPIFTRTKFKTIQSAALGYKNIPTLMKFLTVEETRNKVLDLCNFIDNLWVEKNKASTDKGTAIHLAKEEADLAKGYEIIDHVEYQIIDGSDIELDSLVEGVYLELCLSNSFYKVAGTSDKVIVKKNRKIKISDYKTNGKLTIHNRYQNMHYPITHLSDCNMMHYTIQLSLYGWMLEQYGYEVEDIELIHILDSGEEIVYKIDYIKMEIEAMLDHYKNGMQK